MEEGKIQQSINRVLGFPLIGIESTMVLYCQTLCRFYVVSKYSISIFLTILFKVWHYKNTLTLMCDIKGADAMAPCFFKVPPRDKNAHLDLEWSTNSEVFLATVMYEQRGLLDGLYCMDNFIASYFAVSHI